VAATAAVAVATVAVQRDLSTRQHVPRST